MNKVQVLGRITKDLEVKGEAEKAILKFTVACNRDYKNKAGTYDADFINCIVFGKKAEVIARYFSKGDPILVTNGSILTGSYENKEGHKVYTTEVKVNEFEFLPKVKGETTANNNSEFDDPDYSDDDAPF